MILAVVALGVVCELCAERPAELIAPSGLHLCLPCYIRFEKEREGAMTDETTKAGPVTLRPTAITLKADQLVAFLYDLLRDELPAGKVERLALEAQKVRRRDEVRFSNRHLAAYATDLADRLRLATADTVAPEDYRREVDLRTALVGDLEAVAAQWKGLAASGKNPEAGKALVGAADALLEVLRNRGVLG